MALRDFASLGGACRRWPSPRAASIAVKGLLQAPVVEPELVDGEPTGCWLVTIGEGRRQALRLLAKRKNFEKTPVRCVVDLANAPRKISLDEATCTPLL